MSRPREVAERAEFTRDSGRNKPREVKGETWPTVAQRLRVTGES
jgi:hypothetical protein